MRFQVLWDGVKIVLDLKPHAVYYWDMKNTKQAETETKKTQYVALPNGSILRRRCLEIPHIVRITGSQDANKAEFASRYGMNWTAPDGLGSCYSQVFNGPGPEVAW